MFSYHELLNHYKLINHLYKFSQIVKIHVRRAAGRGKFLFLLVYVCMYLCVYLCHASWPNEKRYRPEIGYSSSHRPYLKTVFFFVSSIFVDFPHISTIAMSIIIPYYSELAFADLKIIFYPVTSQRTFLGP